MRGPKPPGTTGELWLALGLDKPLTSLEQVRAVQRKLSQWVLDAAEERWPSLSAWPEKEVCVKCLENAREKWKQFDSLVTALIEAERSQILDQEPSA